MTGYSPARFLARAKHHLTRTGLRGIILGAIVRTRLQKAGLVVAPGGWTMPTIQNDGGRIEVGSVALYSGVRLEVWRGALLTIGKGTYLNRNTEVVAARSVSIGRDCMIARDVLIMDTDQHALPGADLGVAPVAIEDRVWIGARAIILKGVRIGHDSVIGAGAIVTKSVPPHSVVVGPAARVVRTPGSSSPDEGVTVRADVSSRPPLAQPDA
jgi:acetyltransferase-like isoleucine patch superfamily enzyme